jgi:hypothetical protein
MKVTDIANNKPSLRACRDNARLKLILLWRVAGGMSHAMKSVAFSIRAENKRDTPSKPVTAGQSGTRRDASAFC